MSERKGHKSDGRVKEKTSSSIWNKDGNDFICIPQFHNTIPSAPSGPYLKNLDQQNRYQDFAVYKTSSLEKNYIWQPHFGPDLGLRLDLVDQEAILNPISIRNEDAIDASEMRLLKGDAPDRGRGKLRSLEGGEKPWWLRNTTYLENNLYSSVVQTSNNDFKRPRVGEVFVSGIETFISSFDSVEVNVKKLAREAREKLGTQIEWSIPILPSEDVSNYFVLARFDEDPDTTLNRPPVEVEVEGEETSPTFNEAMYGILANIKQRNPDEENTKTSMTSFYTSFVLPSDDKYVPLVSPVEGAAVSANESGEEKDALTATENNESESSAPKTEDDVKPSGTMINSNSMLYKWMKNFSMDVNTKQDDSFILTIDVPSGAASASASSEKVTRGSVSYHPVRSKLLLKKVTNSDEHLSVVTRRGTSE